MATLRLTATVLDTPDPPALAAFYRRLLGFETVREDPDWVVLRDPHGVTGLSFQREEQHVRPAWPARAGEQQVQDHLDIAVDDLPGAVEHAVAAGASVEGFQPQETVRVLRDPHGHLFCLYLPEE
ncbi:VOC family protein [Kineococcus rhizosphaerae]|uniref:Catechol 2,3-dioxygenase-like lactoylglutathione lyase family enzyme n=1 Tax=Kineococcus rhizosphaerae TaxID=559628 RepID=A0A2T0R340_9ACTN|nr:VOC family protein [Kineococcus rhizosphaerae]PRY14180.1 catechol 2,3-dioxygenase-like lactoylglutathione lyase family enzyme [Kineococcus rhizosphaerae]